MNVKFFVKIIASFRKKGISDYAISKHLGMTQTNLRQYLGEIKDRPPTEKIHPRILSKLISACRRYKTGPRSWKELGEMIDSEYLAPDSENKR